MKQKNIESFKKLSLIIHCVPRIGNISSIISNFYCKYYYVRETLLKSYILIGTFKRYNVYIIVIFNVTDQIYNGRNS